MKRRWSIATLHLGSHPPFFRFPLNDAQFNNTGGEPSGEDGNARSDFTIQIIKGCEKSRLQSEGSTTVTESTPRMKLEEARARKNSHRERLGLEIRREQDEEIELRLKEKESRRRNYFERNFVSIESS